MTSNPDNKMRSLLHLELLNELLLSSQRLDTDQDNHQTSNLKDFHDTSSSTLSITSNTPTTETVEDSLPPSPKVGLPVNFGEVAPGIYRSSFPQSTNFEHLAELKLRTILTLVSEKFSEDYMDFIDSQGIHHYQIMIPPNKEAFAAIPLESMAKAISLISDPTNRPILVHCNKGKHRTGCVIGCYRKMCSWEVGKITSEYRHYAGAKARALDEKYISEFDQEAMMESLNGVAFQEIQGRIGLPTPPASERKCED